MVLRKDNGATSNRVSPALWHGFNGQSSPVRTDGVLPYQSICTLIERRRIRSNEPVWESQIQPASLDLRLGPIGYQVRASFLPGSEKSVDRFVEDLTIQTLDLSKPTVLQKGAVYVIPLMEELALPEDVSGRANPKSTTGRLDLFARLITDRGVHFDRVPAHYKGKLYVEVAPGSFSVVVHAGTTLNQLRFVKGNPASPSDSDLALQETLVYDADGRPADATFEDGFWLSVDLAGKVGDEVVGYRAKQNAPAVDLDQVNYYQPLEYWEPIAAPPKSLLILDPGEFYILGSRERVRVPPRFSAEMVPYDPSRGEFRVHYAGFFDPGFGYDGPEFKGTRAVLEVRSHEVPCVLADGQLVGRLDYEWLLEPSNKVYGINAGSSYQYQGIALSKQFRDRVKESAETVESSLIVE